MSASTYRVAVGSNVALVSLALFVPQPRAGGVKATERTYGLSGAVYEQGPYAILEWSMFETVAELTAVLTACGITTSLNAAVTVYLRNESFAYQRYNAMVQRPQIGVDGDWTQFLLRDFRLVFTNLSTPS